MIPPDPSLYGDNFAEVYDEWYAEQLGSADDVVWALDELVPSGDRARSVLELGIGTGRLALPLHRAGWRVLGIDSSARMIDRLRAKPGSEAIDVRLGDVADASTWPSERVDVVLASFNFLHNLIDPAAASVVLAHATRCLVAPGGIVVAEHDIIDVASAPADSTVASELVAGLRIRTVVDHGSGLVHGTHIEPDGRVRSWHLRPRLPNEYDALATDAGLELVQRWSSWTREPFTPDLSTRAISVYAVAQPSFIG